MAYKEKEQTLEETSTWAVAVVCFILIVISLFIERLIHKIGAWLKQKNKVNLYEALEKLKAELMLLGFISLLLTVAQTPISQICIPKSVASSMRPCSAAVLEARKKETMNKENGGKKIGGRLLIELAESYIPRRSLATKGYNECPENQTPFVSAYGIHQLHIFIFVLALVHVIYCIVTYALGKTKMSKWKQWEEDTKTLEYEYSNDQDRFRFAKDTSFGRRHLSSWSNTNITLWTVCFFRQFYGSVTEVDYKTLRRGFVAAQIGSGGSEKTPYDFFNYIQRTLEKDFKTVVEISPVIWFVTVLFLLTNSDGLHSYMWLPFIPLIVVLIVGTKLQVIITKLGLRILEKGDVVRGAPVVQPGDDLFWFDQPSVMLFLIHLVLFTNAFQLAFFAWSSYEFGFSNCFHKEPQDIAIRIIVGIVVQILCSYVTLPLYALVIQMGTRMKPTVFNKRVSKMLKKWHHTAQKETHHGRHSESNTPHHPTTPPHGSSPIHLLHNSNNRSGENLPPSHSDHHDQHQFQFVDLESQHKAAESSTHHSTSSIELPPIRPANA